MTSASKAAKELEKHLEEGVLLMISGGSSLEVLEYLEPVEGLTISVVDERFSTDPEVNNFSQIEKTKFFDKCLEKGCFVIGTKVHKGETLTMATVNFESQLRRWKDAYPKGKVVALLGIGKDGHTAGVLPMENERLFKDLFLDPEWVASYEAKDYLRFTTTLTFLKEEVDFAVLYAKGKDEILGDLEKDIPINLMPAQVFKEMKCVKI